MTVAGAESTWGEPGPKISTTYSQQPSKGSSTSASMQPHILRVEEPEELAIHLVALIAGPRPKRMVRTFHTQNVPSPLLEPSWRRK